MGWDDGMSDSAIDGIGGGVTPGFWDGRSLGEEPAVCHFSHISW